VTTHILKFFELVKLITENLPVLTKFILELAALCLLVLAVYKILKHHA